MKCQPENDLHTEECIKGIDPCDLPTEPKPVPLPYAAATAYHTARAANAAADAAATVDAATSVPTGVHTDLNIHVYDHRYKKVALPREYIFKQGEISAVHFTETTCTIFLTVSGSISLEKYIEKGEELYSIGDGNLSHRY